MSAIVEIQSTAEFSTLLSSSTIVVADFYADWCGPCKQIAPIYQDLSAALAKPNKITFTKINTDRQQELARSYGVTAMPTFMIFKNARVTDTIQGADPRRLSAAVRKLAEEAGKVDTDGGESSSGSGGWLGASLPRGYSDVTSQIDVTSLELLNWDSQCGNARSIFQQAQPKEEKSDHVESDTDEQLMIYMPFQSTLKVHTLHITAQPPAEDDDDELPSRPKLLKIYVNKPSILGFDEADGLPATQEITLSEKDWDAKTNTAKVELRFVKFQNVTSLVLFVVESEGDNEKVRIDRIRVIGESGEKRDGKIEKISEE